MSEHEQHDKKLRRCYNCGFERIKDTIEAIPSNIDKNLIRVALCEHCGHYWYNGPDAARFLERYKKYIIKLAYFIHSVAEQLSLNKNELFVLLEEEDKEFVNKLLS